MSVTDTAHSSLGCEIHTATIEGFLQSCLGYAEQLLAKTLAHSWLDRQLCRIKPTRSQALSSSGPIFYLDPTMSGSLQDAYHLPFFFSFLRRHRHA